MSNKKFTWDNDLEGNSFSQNFNVLSSKFGDGYEQHTSVGINNRKVQLVYSRKAYSAEIQDIKNFLDHHKGADSFLYDIPLGGEIRVKSDIQYQLVQVGGDVWRISTTFYQQY
ncbi:phage tail protein [Acinetobacter rudis]|uniref:phage tail protein n=1 Tax=Acinetobacter rudis TaxID=632955 RepID=UPI0033412903